MRCLIHLLARFIYCFYALHLIITFIIYFLVKKESKFHTIIFFQEPIIPVSNIADNLIEKKTIFVSAYFELEKSKHSKSEYLTWIRRILPIINCRMIIYVNKFFSLNFLINETRQLPEYQQKLFNFNCTYENAYEISCVSNLSKKFEQMHIKDPLQKYHNSNLYIKQI